MLVFDKTRKFRVSATQPDAKLPVAVQHYDDEDSLLLGAAQMQANWPDATVDVVRQTGFKNGKAIRWRFQGGSLVPVSLFDKSKGTIPMEEEYRAIGYSPSEANRSR